MVAETSLKWYQPAVALAAAGAVGVAGYHSAAVPLDGRAIPRHASGKLGTVASIGPDDPAVDAAYYLDRLGRFFIQGPAASHSDRVWEMSRVVPVDALARPWMGHSLQRIRDLAAMPDDWDTYGSPRIRAEAVDATIQLLWALAPFDPPLPHIVPISGGGLQLEWSVGQRELEIGVAPEGTIDYLKDDADHMEGSDIALSDTRRLAELVAWLREGNTVSAPIHRTSAYAAVS